MTGSTDMADLCGEEVLFGSRCVTCFKDRPADLMAMFQEAVSQNPDGEALVAGLVRLTYKDLDHRTAELATGFASFGLSKGDRIAILIGNRAEFLVTLLATIRIGAIAVPINIREQTPELSYILNHCGARCLIFDAFVKDRLPLAADLPKLDFYYCTDGAFGSVHDFNTLFFKAQPPDVWINEEETAVILYTSGTTGRPKGAMLTHVNIVHSALHFVHSMELGPKDRSIVAVPSSHVTGLVANLFTMIAAHGCSIFLRAFQAQDFLILADRERMTHTLIVPAMYNLCFLRADFADYDLSDWRIGGYGGAPMPEATISRLAEALPGLILVNAYGSTEVTSPATIMPLGDGTRHSDSVGKCVPCGHIRIVDDAGNDVPVGTAGEFWIAGPMVVPGYWEDDEKTREGFHEGYWKSGDIGSCDAEGFYYLHDRKKDMVIRGGYNIYTAELENVIADLPDVIECAVVGREDKVLGEKTHVFIYGSDTLSRDAVRNHCAKHLADYKVPDFITFLTAPLPRNANGKVLKAQLRQLAMAEPASERIGTSPT